MYFSTFYWTYRDCGMHEILSLIPSYLELHKYNFGNDVSELRIDVYFKSNQKPIDTNQKQSLDLYIDRMPKKSTVKFFKKDKKLKIDYPSKHLPYDVEGKTLGKQPELEADGSRGTKRLFKFIKELKGVIEELGPEISRICDFNWGELLKIIEKKLDPFPQRDSALIELKKQRQKYIRKNTFTEEKVTCESNLPSLIPVAYFENSYSSLIGHTQEGNQFWGQVVTPIPENSSNQYKNSFERHFYAILHVFDYEGNHLNTHYKMIDTLLEDSEGTADKAVHELNKFIAKLGSVEYDDIAIKLFNIRINECTFGLINSSSEEYGDSATMEPAGLVFYPPWDGDYDT